jgi:uncharacterized membrane protein YedE/YeeE
MEIITLLLGFLFGGLLVYASLNRYNVISGNAVLKDFTVFKTILLAVGLGALILNGEIAFGLATYHIKPFLFGGVVLGGLVFGTGMAILGYCPGTLAVSLGEGSMDALSGIFGGLLGGWTYTLARLSMQPVMGPDWGKVSLFSLTGNHPVVFFLLTGLFALVLIAAALALHYKERKTMTNPVLNDRWLYSGIGLAILNSIVFLKGVSNRPIGASTSYPYVADSVTGLTHNAYFSKVSTPGHWELIFLAGAFLAGLIFSLGRRDFKITIVHSRWAEYKGKSAGKRLFWAFTGGFILLFGARMAGGCTSEHIISGGMQLALSSWIFGVFVFIAFIVTGKLFYKK